MYPNLFSFQALEIIRGCKGLNIVGCDLVEVAPIYDVSGESMEIFGAGRAAMALALKSSVFARCHLVFKVKEQPWALATATERGRS